MTLHAVAVPKWGLAMEEGALTSWLVSDNALVAAGQEIAEIETSKIANALEAPAAGVLRRRVAFEGDVRPVGALLAVLADAEEDETAIDTFVAEYEARFFTAKDKSVAGPQAETVTIDGQSIRFLRLDAREEAGAVPIVLLHGFGGDHLNWTLVQEALTEFGDVYALDLPGHGGSSKDVGDGTLEFLATGVVKWLDLLTLGQVRLVGHSMGAAVAATIALARPERVRSLTAISGAGFGGPLNRDYLEGFLAASRRKDLQPIVEMLMVDPALTTRGMQDDLIAYKRIDGVLQALRKLIDNALAEDGLERLQARLCEEAGLPILVVFGAEDRIAPPSRSNELPARWLLLEGIGHMPHVEAPGQVSAELASFFRDNG